VGRFLLSQTCCQREFHERPPLLPDAEAFHPEHTRLLDLAIIG
jgi:hypothetical protein